MRFRVTYARPSDLVADAEQQFARGGLLVRAEPPVDAGIDRGAAVELELVTPHGKAVAAATVIAPLPGSGVALAFDAAAFAALVEAARRGGATAGAAPVHEVVGDDAEEAPAQEAGAGRSDPTVAQKIQIALHGDRGERLAILRDVNKVLHPYVLRNPGVQLDEIVWIAKQATMSAEVLTQIANRREWVAKPEVVVALVRNPKTPTPLAIKLLELVPPGELRLLAKQTTVREAVQRAARKKLLG